VYESGHHRREYNNALALTIDYQIKAMRVFLQGTGPISDQQGKS